MTNESDDNEVKFTLNVPKEVWGDLAGFVKQIFGPVSEAADLLSDKIRFVRFKTALKTIRRAKELAEEENLDLKQVPLKFLVPFLEQCSLEEEDSELIEQWARLLVSAATEYDVHHPAFVDILSQIGPNEAKLLKHIWEIRKKEGFNKLKTLLSIYAEDTASHYGSKKVSLDEWEKRGFLIMAGSVDALGDHRDSERTVQNIRSLLILERQNLIKIQAVEGKHTPTDKGVFVVNAVLTPLGYEFVSACESSQQEEKQGAT